MDKRIFHVEDKDGATMDVEVTMKVERWPFAWVTLEDPDSSGVPMIGLAREQVVGLRDALNEALGEGSKT
jgi:hypothetical protein